MIKLIRTNSDNPDFIRLVKFLDIYLAEKDGDEHSFYDQYNKTDDIKYVVVAFNTNIPVACGAIKEFDPETMEVKRMYTSPDARRMGAATAILNELEKWSIEMNYRRCILETGKKQAEAIRLYALNKYSVIPNYGQYAGVENSICFEKLLQ